MAPIGIVGLGLLGSAVAGRLRAAGHQVIGHDVVPERNRALEAIGGRAAPSAVVVAEVAVEVVVVDGVVVVVLPIGIGSVGSVIVGMGTWAICTRVSATGRARPGLSPRTAKLASAAARRRMRAERRRTSELMMRLLPARSPSTIRPRKNAPQYPGDGKN